MNGHDIKRILNTLYPEQTAYEWDNVGLQIGDLDREAKSILIALDATFDVFEEARTLGVDWILTHHPLLFRPMQRIDTTTYAGKLIRALLRHDITLYAAHTNYDVAARGMNVHLGERLGLHDINPLVEHDDAYGLGVVGTLHQPRRLTDFIEDVKQALDVSTIRMIGEADRTVGTVALVAGSGSSAIPSAIDRGVDVLLTGDVTYHHALEAAQHGFTILDVGHHIERLALPALKAELEAAGVTIPIHVSSRNHDPYRSI
jgi:dinuclear metal center YbgI/SA1388 family protein